MSQDRETAGALPSSEATKALENFFLMLGGDFALFVEKLRQGALKVRRLDEEPAFRRQTA
jgi:hypothetical protein